ncbi:zinc finger ZZ-type and EF-hand domain-containing protein 1 [Aplysia californica]|uniref:Zinc finger ZZ-type and EF-hand domain-containing protein 1 n=1 Tax=Aplysia californica TaxID=6500 RepID=A0ABM1A316_APLCA|nr:zinc finger ZZ-type and EF-hand domain-containing protein 1 [Aplysia californica]
MGNALSESDEEGRMEAPNDPEDDTSDGEDNSDGDSKPATDLCYLFTDQSSLRVAATKVKEKFPEVALLLYNSQIIQWLESRADIYEDSITQAQFCDMLIGLGVERAEAIKAFHQFDSDGSGVAEVAAMIEAVAEYSNRSALGELGKSIRTLQSCALTPGFVDVYAGSSHPVNKHGSCILKYLLRNRAESASLPFPFLNTFNNTFIMRSVVLKNLLNAAKDDLKENELEGDINDFEKKTIHNCYQSLEVSSNASESNLSRHGRQGTMFWQSDGAARSHFIRLRIKPNVVLKTLSIGVMATDQSYMPELVTVSVGQSVGNLREINEVKVDSHATGQVVVLRNMKTYYPYVQINIKRCHGEGCDTRIHGVKAVGFKLVKEAGISVLDASALWYLQMLTTTVSVNLVQSPALRTMLLEHTKKALEHMPPLVLSSMSSSRPAFLSKHVLHELEVFAETLSQSTENPDQLTVDGLQVLLALNFARGSVAGLIRMLHRFKELPSVSLPCAELLSKAMINRNTCWESLGTPISVSLLASDGGEGSANLGPEVVIESFSASSGKTASSSPNRAYVTDEGVTKCTMIFKSEENVKLTKIKIQVSPGNKGARHGLVFVYNPDTIPELSEKFDKEEHMNFFSKYDFWRSKEFEFSIGYRKAGLGGMPDNPVAYFRFDNDCDMLDVPVSWDAVGQYLLVKFLEPRHESATRLGIVSVRFSGISRQAAMINRLEKPLAMPDPAKKSTCDLPEIMATVLTFITDLATDQVRRRSMFRPQFEFLDLSDLDATSLWELHLACEERLKEEGLSTKVFNQWQRSSMLLLQLIHGLIPVLASSKATSEASRDALFQQLCEIVNTQSEVEVTPATASSITYVDKLNMIRQIIIDGAPLFFPEKTKKRDELFKLMKTEIHTHTFTCSFSHTHKYTQTPKSMETDFSDQSSQPSMSLVFQSLCQFFSSVDPKGLLDLPSKTATNLCAANTLDMMRSLLVVATQEQEGLHLTSHTHRRQPTPTTPSTPTATVTTSEIPAASPATTTTATTTSVPASVTTATATTSTAATMSDLTSSTCPPPTTTTSAPPTTNACTPSSTPLPASPDVKTQLSKDLPERSPESPCSAPLKAVGAGVGEGEGTATGAKTSEVVKPVSESGPQMTYLVRLTASLQTALFSWCWQQLEATVPQEEEKFYNFVNDIIVTYSCEVAGKANQYFEKFKSMSFNEVKAESDAEEPSFLFILVRQMMLLLSSVVDHLNMSSKVRLLHDLKPLITAVTEVARNNPELFCDICSTCWDNLETEETTLRTWEVESPHDYHNHSNINQTFHCPGASKLLVEFDPRCETERRYDYLEFADARGLKLRFDEKVGTGRWPRKVTFSGPYVLFSFHSDSSNTDWGYKFTVTAKGDPDVPLSWLSDLHLSVVKLLGQLSGATLSSNPIMLYENPGPTEDLVDQDILRSELWTSLFRGGYIVGKLQRSLSGKFATGDESRVSSFLLEVLSVEEKGEESAGNHTADGSFRKQASRFLTKCQEAFKAKNQQVQVGGEKVSRAVVALFTALVWHCQALREDTDKFLSGGDLGEVTEGITQAYVTAESVRLNLTSERQKWNNSEDRTDDTDPAEVLTAKASFLLKFSGLTKMQMRSEMRSKLHKQTLMKKAGNVRPAVVRNEIMEKYPSFRLVMEFVQDPAWTAQRVHQLLQERVQFAGAVSDVFMYAAEMIRIMSAHSSPFQIPLVLYFREMLAYQEKFAKHYAHGLDGCGLDLEAKVRCAYYSLVRRLVEMFRSPTVSQQLDSKRVPACDFLKCCLLHLLDVEWQPYDLNFVVDMELPRLYMSIAKETVKMRDLNTSDVKEEDELLQYDLSMKLFSEIKDDFTEWFARRHSCNEDKKELKMFVARFSDVIDVEISCDGCGVTLPGRRYRCLQCDDMDLCTSCFSSGVEPEEHRDDHEIVHLVYKCNHCQAFIVGTRIHCNQCDDFDLCLGCHIKQKFPSGHTEKHDITKIPMVKLKTSQSSNSSLKTYVHQHVWMLYTSLTLALSDIVYGTEPGAAYLDSDYIKMAGLLQQQCVTQATLCLDHVTKEIDGEAEKEVPVEKRREQTFAIHSQERIMGLLGAVMPSGEHRERVAGTGFNFWTKDFLDRFLRVSRGENGYELNTQHLALRLLGRLLANGEIKATKKDDGGQGSEDEGAALLGASADEVKAIPSNAQIISRLFYFGTKSFEKSSVEWACSVARMLEMLSTTPQWGPVIDQHVAQCVASLKATVTVSSIFPMFVIAGFPEVLTTGTLVDYSSSVEPQRGVVLKHFPDKYQTLLVDLRTRKRHTVKDQQVSCRAEVTEILEQDTLAKFVSFVIASVQRIKAGEELSVETLWVVSLALKVLNRSLKSEGMCGVGGAVFTGTFMQALVYLACTGTGLNQNWRQKDLEVLSLLLYTHDGSAPKKTKISPLKEKKKKKGGDKEKNEKKSDDSDGMNNVEDDDDDDDDSDDEISLSDSDKDDNDSNDDDDEPGWTTTSDSDYEDADEEPNSTETPQDEGAKQLMGQQAKELLEALHQELAIPEPVLEALCAMNEGSPEGIIKSILENFGGDSENVTEFLTKWKAKQAEAPEKKETTSENAAIDTGITTHANIGETHRIPETATAEAGDNPQDLFKQQGLLEDEIGERMRSKSAGLLKRELDKHGRTGSRDYLAKVNLALTVLYARHALTSLLASWPTDGPAINSSLLGCKDVKQIPCVLDLLYKIDTRNFITKVVDRVIHQCDAASLVPIAYTAAQFMEEVTLSAVSRESAHPYSNRDDKKKGHIQLAGAPYLTVTFDSKCATCDEDVLTFSTRQQLDKDVHKFSGPFRSTWSSFHIPGDTLYFKFTMNEYADYLPRFGFKFTVMPGTRDSFETGHAILQAVLSSSVARSLPLGQLWSSLVYVACRQPGLQRLKAISLMIKILTLQSRSGPSQESSGLSIDLHLVKPLWELYRGMTREGEEANVAQPAVVRALTDLFLHTENLAMEWDVSEAYIVALMDVSDVCSSIVQGLTNVAAIGQMIGHENAATEFITKIRSLMTDSKLMTALKAEISKS